MKKEAPYDDEREDLRRKLGCRDDGHAQVQRAVVDLMLEGMAALVGRDADRGDGTAVIDIGGEAESLAARIVMVPEHVVDLDNLNIAEPGVSENPPGCVSTSAT